MSAHDKFLDAQKEDSNTAAQKSVARLEKVLHILKKVEFSVELENKKQTPENSAVWVRQQFIIDKIIEWIGKERIDAKDVYLAKISGSKHLTTWKWQ